MRVYSMLEDATPTWRDFDVTVIYDQLGVAFVRATIEGRLCNVHYRAANYISGERPPNYPMPAIPIDVEYDMAAEGHEGYWDLWIGHDPCAHVEYFCKR